MGKYFKEDNNQRFSKVSKDINVKALAENSIRLAQWWKGFKMPKFNMPEIPGLGATRQRTRPTKSVGPEKLRTPSVSKPGETTYVDKLGRGVKRYVGNTEIKTDIFNQLISAIVKNPVYQLLSKISLADFEKNRAIITQTLDTAYDIPFIVNTKTGSAVSQQRVELRDLLAQMIRNNNKITINGNKIDALDAKTYEAIMADIKRLDDHARRADLYRILLPSALVGGGLIKAKQVAHSPGAQAINRSLVDQGLDTNLRNYAGVDLNTFKASSSADQQKSLNKIADSKIKEQITKEVKTMGYLK